MLMTIYNLLTGRTRVTVKETERLLVLRDGRYADILGPGRHTLRRSGTELIRYELPANGTFASSECDALKRARPDLFDAHFLQEAAAEGEAVLISRDGRPARLLSPGDLVTLWKAAGPWEVERVALDAALVPAALAKRLEAAGMTGSFTTVTVAEAHVGLLSVDGALTGELAPGAYRLWAFGPKATVKVVDLRWRAHEVIGQDILTRDRVTLRVNLTATYRVSDPRQAVTSTLGFEQALHRALQLAFRKTLGALSLDDLLADKVAVDAAAADAVRAEMAALGLEVAEIALKDVILPGEMREILNRVVSAEKEAEANVIRRREETNAVRSLHNTAKVMADNPVMLRLKELEALETIASKVERLTVHNGTAGLLDDIVKLRD